MTNRTLSTMATEMLTVRMNDYDGCVAAFKDADVLGGTSFTLMIEAMSTAHDFYTEKNGKSAGFLKQFQEDTRLSYDHLSRLNRIRKDEFLVASGEKLGFNKCVQLIGASAEVREAVTVSLDNGDDVALSDIKQQVAEAKAKLSDEALEELKEDVRKDDQREKDQRKKEREATALEKADEYALEDDYTQLQDDHGTCNPELVAGDQVQVIEGDFEEVEEDPIDENLNEIIGHFDPAAPWAPTLEVAEQVIQHIAAAYRIDLSTIIPFRMEQ